MEQRDPPLPFEGVRTAAALQGSLADVAIDDVLRLLEGRSRSGVLVVNRANPLRVVLAHGQIVHGGTSSTMALGRLLLAGGLVSAEQLSELFGLGTGRPGDRRHRPGDRNPEFDDTRVLEQLVDEVPALELAGAVRTLAVATVFEMMLLTDADLQFDEAPPHALAERFSTPVGTVLDEAAAQMAAWPELRSRVGDESTIFRRVRRVGVAQTPVFLDAVDWAALSEIDERCSAGQVAHRLGLGRYDAAHVLAGLLERGLVER